MPISVLCKCGTRFDVPDHYAGRTGNCTSCQAPLVVPGPPSAENVSASAFGRVATPAAETAAMPAAAVAPAAPAPRASAEHAAAGAGPFAGKTLGQYQLQRLVGGASSTVYLARKA